jgi:hypothetical protein
VFSGIIFVYGAGHVGASRVRSDLLILGSQVMGPCIDVGLSPHWQVAAYANDVEVLIESGCWELFPSSSVTFPYTGIPLQCIYIYIYPFALSICTRMM